jgi:hypothetical protein
MEDKRRRSRSLPDSREKVSDARRDKRSSSISEEGPVLAGGPGERGFDGEEEASMWAGSGRGEKRVAMYSLFCRV